MSSPEAAGRKVLWVIELSEFDIQYRPRIVIKGEVITEFITEFTNMQGQGAEEHRQWSIYMDGSSNRQAGGAGVVLHSPEGDKVECMVCLDFPITNNEAEYEALVAGLDLAKVTGATSVIIHCDSQVVISQINGYYECKRERMKKYQEQVQKRASELRTKFVQIPREENEQVDCLAKAASAEHMLISGEVLSFIQLSPLIDGVNIQEISSGSDWTTLIVSYLKNATLPDSKEAAKKLKV
ncbi:uncharacterized protein LOC142644475 [Castanea sativa]|uniref:uncharacterized protein LOC142644475 n=1 Tax=Castanea sativa TaxID=21020 RepID=UPI003F64ECAD